VRFQPGERLGSGGVAEVHRALDLHTGETVALKRLLPQLAQDRAVRRRFMREAEVAGSLQHPAIVRIIDAGEAAGRPYLAMELALGDDLRRHLTRRTRLPWEEARALALTVARALEHAHQRGVIHRDVKPQNVLGAATSPRLADFGLARLESLAGLTGSSVVWGSPEYMAPELFGRGRADPRSDLYSLGVVLFEMVTGALPWKDRSLARLALSERDRPAPLPSLGLGPDWDHLMAALLSPSPADRPASASELIAALTAGPAAAALVASIPCTACGAPRPEDIPRCFACGHQQLERGHTPGGEWSVLLTGMKDDAASMTAIHRTLGALTGSGDLRLKFVIGDKRMYSEKERKSSINLPATLFSDLDAETAQAVTAALATEQVKVRPAHRRKLTLRRLGATAWMAGGAGLAATGLGTSVGFLFAGGMMMAMVGAAVWRRQTDAGVAPLFQLRDPGAPAPLSGRLLEAARATSVTLAVPEARALFVEASQEIYRLGRRAESLASGAAPGSSEEALARRLLAAAPAVSARLESLTARLEVIDGVLAGHSEGEAIRALAALERRLSAAGDGERPGLLEARRELEAGLDRRHHLSADREALAASLCTLLATLRDLFRRARQLSTSEERESAAALAALAQLERDLSAPGPGAPLPPSEG
jgi:hypothetical protein